ncbi:MAG: ribosome maturation factor RimM [Pseudomonadota bacterium]
MTAVTPATRADEAPSAWVMLAVFTQPHGVSGRIKVKSFTDPADDFATHPALTDEAGNPITLRITGHTQGLPVVAIDGVTRREQAELLRGKKIGVLRAQLPVLDTPNRFYTADLIGLPVIDASGAPFGEVFTVANYGAGDILDITRPNGKREMYAFNHATFPEVDVATRRLVIHPPEILGSATDTDAD